MAKTVAPDRMVHELSLERLCARAPTTHPSWVDRPVTAVFSTSRTGNTSRRRRRISIKAGPPPMTEQPRGRVLPGSFSRCGWPSPVLENDTPSLSSSRMPTGASSASAWTCPSLHRPQPTLNVSSICAAMSSRAAEASIAGRHSDAAIIPPDRADEPLAPTSPLTTIKTSAPSSAAVIAAIVAAKPPPTTRTWQESAFSFGVSPATSDAPLLTA